jgi:hypothetical protein
MGITAALAADDVLLRSKSSYAPCLHPRAMLQHTNNIVVAAE